MFRLLDFKSQIFFCGLTLHCISGYDKMESGVPLSDRLQGTKLMQFFFFFWLGWFFCFDLL